VVCHAGLVHNSTYVLAKLARIINFDSSCTQHKFSLLVLQICTRRELVDEREKRDKNKP
jgi:hypothetical protein